MTWYDPKSWFKKEELSTLYCANPQCGSEITENEMAYNSQYNEVYHDQSCAQFTNAHRAMETGKVTIMNLDYIDRKKALKLLVSGDQDGSLSMVEDEQGALSDLEELLKNSKVLSKIFIAHSSFSNFAILSANCSSPYFLNICSSSFLETGFLMLELPTLTADI